MTIFMTSNDRHAIATHPTIALAFERGSLGLYGDVIESIFLRMFIESAPCPAR